MFCWNFFANKEKYILKWTEHTIALAILKIYNLGSSVNCFIITLTFVQNWGTSKGTFPDSSSNLAKNYGSWYYKFIKTNLCGSSTLFGSLLSVFSLKWDLLLCSFWNICDTCVFQPFLLQFYEWDASCHMEHLFLFVLVLFVLSGPVKRYHHQLNVYQKPILPQWPQCSRKNYLSLLFGKFSGFISMYFSSKFISNS